MQNPIVYTNTLPDFIPSSDTLPKALVYFSKPKKCQQPIRSEAEKLQDIVIQQELSTKTPKNTRELSTRSEDPSRFSAGVGSP